MKAERLYRVQQVAKLAGVSVRTLHHYDDLGLLRPKERSAAGYRLYGSDDFLRLQQILIGRELGLSLETIRRSLDDPKFDRRQALLEQRKALLSRIEVSQAMIHSIDSALAALSNDRKKGPINMKALFDGFDPSAYEEEVRERWGSTNAYKESARRTRGYSAEDMKRIKSEQADIHDAAFAVMKAGKPSSSTEAMEVAERARLFIDRWFYPCSPAMHAGLADMYEADERFAASIEKHGAGLTAFFAAAIRANAGRVK